MARKKPGGKSHEKRKTVLEQRMKEFSEEVEDMGEKFGKRMEKHGKGWERRGKEWDGWFHRTLGVVGPLVSSVMGIVVLGLLIWVISFINSKIGSWLLTDINIFLANNIGVFFLIFLFFSYTSYFSKFYKKVYRLFSPVSIAVGAGVCFWIATHAINTVNVSLGIPFLSVIAFSINESLFLIFWLFLCVGYLVLAIIIATEKTIWKPEEYIEKPRPQKEQKVQGQVEMRRLYRSGKDRILGGVCGGIAEYLGVDPVIIRLLWVVGTLAWGFGILLYIIFWIIMPRNPEHRWK